MVVIKKILISFVFLSFLLVNNSYASRILDYETELFVQNIINDINLIHENNPNPAP